MEKVVLLSGGSSGIGLAAARSLAKRGCKVYEISRREITHPEGILHLTGDVTDEAAVAALVQQVDEQEGRIDVLICCAGFGISGAAEFTETADAKRLLETNLFGAVHCIRAVLPVMRRQGRGTVLAVSSVAAPIAIPFQSWYSVSKAALSAYCAALREEIRPFGIQVCAVLPGDIRTGFTAAREKSPVGDELYGGRIARSVGVMERDEENGMSPETAGEAIAALALKKHLKPYCAIGLGYKGAVLLSRLLPCRLTGRLVGWIYAR